MSELQVPTRWRDALSELEPAPHVLADLLEAVRSFVDGECLYIPRKACNKKSWGERKNSRAAYKNRNLEILAKHQGGISAKELAATYYLSVKTVYKIIAAMRS